MALLFAADRRDHLHREVLPGLRRGSWVVSDRYVHSSVAYQSVAGTGDGEAVAWVRSLNQGVRVPDLTVVLEVPAVVAARRRAARGEPRELYEADGLQRRLVDFYRRIDDHFPGEAIVLVDGDRPLDEVAEDVFAAVAPLLVPAGPDSLPSSTP
jgi:dTMP kinase